MSIRLSAQRQLTNMWTQYVKTKPQTAVIIFLIDPSVCFPARFIHGHVEKTEQMNRTVELFNKGGKRKRAEFRFAALPPPVCPCQRGEGDLSIFVEKISCQQEGQEEGHSFFVRMPGGRRVQTIWRDDR